MKSFISITTALLAALTQATGILPPFDASLTFHGAAPDASYSFAVMTDGNFVLTDSSLSISSISSTTSTNCTALGVNGSVTTIVGAKTVPVGPPQAQVVVACTEL